MHTHAKFSASVKQISKQIRPIAVIADCTSVIAGLSIAIAALTVHAVGSAQAADDQPILQSKALSNTSVTRLEIHLNRRQAVLYQDSVLIKRYTIGTGKQGWETPTGTFRVLQMQRHPNWINPFTNERITANDPRNPLRGYWIGFWTNGKNWIGFHGTLNASSVGKAASHGCIHMYDSDLEDLFSQVSVGTQVKVLP